MSAYRLPPEHPVELGYCFTPVLFSQRKIQKIKELTSTSMSAYCISTSTGNGNNNGLARKYNEMFVLTFVA